jgi:hypothetical protein
VKLRINIDGGGCFGARIREDRFSGSPWQITDGINSPWRRGSNWKEVGSLEPFIDQATGHRIER